MSNWIENALQALDRSLNPISQELNEIDWKSGLSNKSERLAQHISAFANHPNGGFLAFGINNDGVPNPLVKGSMDEIISKMGNIARNNLSQPIGIEHAVLNYQDHPILFIYIPECTEKPVSLRGGNLYDSYKRSAGQTVKLSKHEVKHLISISIGMDFESQVALSNVSDDDVLKCLDYDSYYSLHNKRLSDTKINILQTLASEDLIKSNYTSWDILNLGGILFAKNLSVFKNLKRKSVRVIIYNESSRINAIKEFEENKGYASGFEGLINYIMDKLPANEIIENAIRKKMDIYPEVAIREFVANALIHQDFSIAGSGIMVEIFFDRIEITNPGIPLVDINRFIDTAPKSRNEKLASLMRRLNICEERGSGIDRAISAIETFQLPAPKIIKGDDYTRVIVYAPIPLAKMSKEDRIRACYQHTCLYYVNNQPVNNQSIRKRFNISKNNTSYASKIISETLEIGLIKSSDPDNVSKKFASYIPFWA